MMLYLLIILVAVAIISSVVALATTAHFLPVLGITAFAVLVVVAVDALTATVCRLLPAKCASPEKKGFVVSAKEKKFYEKLKIRKWKDKVPEIGQFTGFRKNKLEDPNSVEYLDRFLLEIGYGELGHFFSLFTSFLILLLFPLFSDYGYGLWFSISIPVAFVSALMNIPSFMILRYTSYKLRVLRESRIKKLRKEEEAAKRAAEEAFRQEAAPSEG